MTNRIPTVREVIAATAILPAREALFAAVLYRLAVEREANSSPRRGGDGIDAALVHAERQVAEAAQLYLDAIAKPAPLSAPASTSPAPLDVTVGPADGLLRIGDAVARRAEPMPLAPELREEMLASMTDQARAAGVLGPTRKDAP